MDGNRMIYTPDRWVLVEIKLKGEVIQKVLASWYGGYLGSDSWKLSSGVTKIEEIDGHYNIHNESGSIYKCMKHNRGMSGYASSVLEGFRKDLENIGTIEIVETIEVGDKK